MSGFPGSPRLLKGAIVTIDPLAAVPSVTMFQYNPDTLTRSLQVQAAGAEGGERSDPLRLKGPPVETIRLEAEIDAADQLELPAQHPHTVQSGILPQLAALETLIYPKSSHLQENNRLAALGTLEIIPAEAPLTLFVWNKARILPVRLTEFSITEEAFDPALNPIRAKVSLGMRVLSVTDLGFSHRGGNLFMAFLAQKERLADLVRGTDLGALGIGGIP